jgi:uncharacterized protein DUF4232
MRLKGHLACDRSWALGLAAVTATAVVTAIAAPALAAPAAPAGASPACRPAQLRITAPASIPGDPGAGLGQTSWNIVLRNRGKAGPGSGSCSLRGWPGLTVRRASGAAVPTRVADVRASNLRAVPDAGVNLRPGAAAVVTVVAPARAAGCVTRWSVDLTLRGASQPVRVAEPGGPGSVCAGGQLQASPFYPESELDRAIAATRALPGHPAFRTTTAPEPAACRPAALRARVASQTAQAGGTVITLSLTTTGPACVVSSGGWPTVRLHESGGASLVAKDLPYAGADASKPFTTYVHAGNTMTALALRPGVSVAVALLAPASGSSTCRAARSATVYPTALALGAGTTVSFARPVSVCGPVRTLSYQAGPAGAGAVSIARGAMAAANSPDVITPDNDSPNGYWYGSDGPTDPACGSSVPYREASRPSDCKTTKGKFGGYLGETGRWDTWKNCDNVGIGWNTGAYNKAQANFGRGYGVGAGAYWMMAGPGRDGHYTSASADKSWGKAQAARALSDIGQKALGFPYVFMDIEQFGGGVDNGWNNAYRSTCAANGNTIATTIASSLDRDTFNGFYGEIVNDSSFLPGVYSAGGGGAYEWSGVFGGQTLGNTGEWTYEGETSSLSSWPSGFSVRGASASWFARAPSKCHLVWQWTGGAVQNGSPDFRVDQFDGNNVKRCS